MWGNIGFDYDFEAPFDDHVQSLLPRIVPSFFVPPLEDKPQNPIMDTLKVENMNATKPARHFRPSQLPQELAILTFDKDLPRKEEESWEGIKELWDNAVTRKLGIQNGILSWDRLRSSRSARASSTPYLSEQDDLVFASARNYVQPRLFNPLQKLLYVTEKELFISLKTVVLGFSSQYHVWDPIQERFVQVDTGSNGKTGFIFVDGKDEVVSDSIISRFLKIGTLLRRLDTLLSSLRSKSAKEGPTIHAFAHSLSTVIDYIREGLKQSPPSKDELSSKAASLRLLSIWTQYETYEELLVALAELYQRNEALSPEAYPSIESSPIPLLSRIYEQLSYHYDHNSPPIILATIGFILTSTSREYLQDVARSIGFAGQPLKAAKSTQNRMGGDDFDIIDDEEEEEEDIFDQLDKIQTSFPTFFPQKVLHALPAAQKSLVLFQVAQPDSPYLTSNSTRFIRWLWTAEEILAAWNNLPLPAPIVASVFAPPKLADPAVSDVPYKPELLDFQIYDQEPGAAISDASLQIRDSSYILLQTFINTFPTSLPPITPTLSELTSLTFKDLLDHASTLSTSLLSLFINSSGVLNFRSHLILLRSYLLIAAPSFKSRLLNALFSDAGEYGADTTAHSMTIQSLRRRPGKKARESKQPWAIGLSPHLLERETWPPVGADLSFFLRTVIVDSLDSGREMEDGKIEREQVVDEAEWRLGFAIRDLPTGAGRDKWLDPLSIEALDFLYMDYKPPHPLEILISPDILSKYQRMFAFILRLLRVESALKSLFRMSTHRAIATYLFPTLTPSRKLLLHFRFLAQAFVSSLSGYIFDTAIGGNFDPFLARLSPDNANPTNDNDPVARFSDVFELAQRHSALLDDILSACLLRSGQRGVGDLLRQCLELVLEFCIVVGELHRGRLQEYQAAPMIEELFRKFSLKMTTFMKVLKGLVDKGPSSSTLAFELYSGGERRPTGGVEALYHLLLRLDLTDWWSKSGRR
ncbi:gamma-tubulin complex, DGRIP91/SPC98 component protein [Pholiota conissans]|uniref:Spindle pole body component n=1 Tax=Pholiota conissans TaxID=109636 RepID=A0A9P5YT03_9AGAR|nr:gamma-tubulin complex, DGRIP91/SPC98 component protein [Pholiota conissans]